MNFLYKIILYIKKPKVVIITGRGRSSAAEAVWQVLKSHFKVKKLVEKKPTILSILTKDIFLIEADLKNDNSSKKINYLIKKSQLPILVVSHVGEIPKDQDSFSGDPNEITEIQELAKVVPNYGFLILNSDDKAVQDIDKVTNLKTFNFGFKEEADFRASDVHINTGTNFKINYKGNIIPIWTEGGGEKEKIYSVLAASSVGIVLGLNFVEISESFKNYKATNN